PTFLTTASPQRMGSGPGRVVVGARGTPSSSLEAATRGCIRDPSRCRSGSERWERGPKVGNPHLFSEKGGSDFAASWCGKVDLAEVVPHPPTRGGGHIEARRTMSLLEGRRDR